VPPGSLARGPEGSRQIGHQALNLSKPFSSRSRPSAVVCLSRGVAVSPYQRVLSCLAGWRMVS
jgi:hypothetical protein